MDRQTMFLIAGIVIMGIVFAGFSRATADYAVAEMVDLHDRAERGEVDLADGLPARFKPAPPPEPMKMSEIPMIRHESATARGPNLPMIFGFGAGGLVLIGGMVGAALLIRPEPEAVVESDPPASE